MFIRLSFSSTLSIPNTYQVIRSAFKAGSKEAFLNEVRALVASVGLELDENSLIVEGINSKGWTYFEEEGSLTLVSPITSCPSKSKWIRMPDTGHVIYHGVENTSISYVSPKQTFLSPSSSDSIGHMIISSSDHHISITLYAGATPIHSQKTTSANRSGALCEFLPTEFPYTDTRSRNFPLCYLFRFGGAGTDALVHEVGEQFAYIGSVTPTMSLYTPYNTFSAINSTINMQDLESLSEGLVPVMVPFGAAFQSSSSAFRSNGGSITDLSDIYMMQTGATVDHNIVEVNGTPYYSLPANATLNFMIPVR